MGDYKPGPRIDFSKLTEDEKLALVRKNNPELRRVGPYTGRCAICESNDLWDDATIYGCNVCGALFPNC